MGNCASTYSLDRCVALTEEPLDADPGIVGLGVLGGFAVTALLTFGAIILGYLTKALPEDSLTDLDHRVVDKIASSWVGVISVKAWLGFIRISRRCLFLKPPNEKDDLSADQRREALKKFVLTLSDQQLVTGIAILVACFANWCRTSVYELNMVVALAWFSSATHLATLDVLQDYFKHNRVVRNWRMIGMVAIVLLLIAGLLLTGFYTNTNADSAPLPCLSYLSGIIIYDCNGTIFRTNTTLLDNAAWNATSYDNSTVYENGTSYANASSYDDCNWYGGNGEFDMDIILYLGPVFTVAYLVYGYASALLRTFAISENIALTPLHMSIYLSLKVFNPRTKSTTMEVIDKTIIKCRAKRRADFNQKFAKLFKITYSNRFQQLSSVFATYRESFLSHIGGLFFAMSYGFSRVVAYRWAFDGPSLEAGSNRVDFGQVVPLVLLVLPLLAAAEIFHENDDKEAEEVLNKDVTSAPTADGNTEVHGGCNSDSITASEIEQAHVILPDPASLHKIASTPQISQQPAGSHRKSIESPQRSGVQGHEPFGVIFLFHIITSILVGILLNLSTAAVVAGPVIMSLIFIFVLGGNCSEAVSAVFLLYRATRDKTLDEDSQRVPTADKDIELPAMASGRVSQRTTAAQPFSSANEAPHDRGTVMAAPDLGKDVSQHSQGHDLPASQTTLHGQEVVDDSDSDNRLYLSPSRQDTESGLRGWHSPTVERVASNASIH
ncbi:hypothetical protein MMC26_000336 [Xylographa opegraphella]|nr:hypothetical protein [Xylographa opegraphella]